jgi:hypothetical protein
VEQARTVCFKILANNIPEDKPHKKPPPQWPGPDQDSNEVPLTHKTGTVEILLKITELFSFHLQHKNTHKVHFEKPTGKQWSPYGCHYYPDPKAFPQPNLDSLPHEPLKKGEQYYLDLAGNICKVGCMYISSRYRYKKVKFIL